MTVGELLGRISSRELSEWMAYYMLEPFGAERDNLHAGLVAAMVHNVNRDPKRGKAADPKDFMLEFGVEADAEGQRSELQTAGDVYGMMRTWAILAGANGAES
jgi:hypothetical protein